MSVAHATRPDAHWRARALELAQDWRCAALFLFGFSVIIRFIEIDRPPHVDELYHILAAKGWLVHGEPRIADGLYTRAQLFTMLVAGSLGIFGDNLVAARLPSIIAGSLLVAAVFLWTRAVAGTAAAWIAALLLCLSAMSFQLFLWARFYALHALVFWLAAIGAYALVEARLGLGTRLGLAVGSVGAALLALHLQTLTLVGLAALAFWLGLAAGLPWLWSLGGARWRWPLLIGIAGALLAALALLVSLGLLDGLWQGYRSAPPHSAEHRNEVWFYHLLLLQRYPAIWPFFPFVGLIALAVRPRPALFCFSVFTAVFVLELFAGMKDQRYLLFAMPFFYVLCGIALAATLGRLVNLLSTAGDRAAAALLPGGLRRPAKWAAIAASLLFLIGANGSTAKTALTFVGVRLSADDGGIGIASNAISAAWSAAGAALEPWLDEQRVVVTMAEELTLYYIGDYDILIDRNRAAELRAGEFAVDPRNGRTVVSEPASVELILDCYREGLIIGDTQVWRKRARVDDQLADLIERRTTRIDLPIAPPLVLFRWERVGPRPDACADLTQIQTLDAG